MDTDSLKQLPPANLQPCSQALERARRETVLGRRLNDDAANERIKVQATYVCQPVKNRL